jgi:hypothetical protein
MKIRAFWHTAQRRVVSLKQTDVSEVSAASIIRAFIALLKRWSTPTTLHGDISHIRRRENLKSHMQAMFKSKAVSYY